MGACDITPSVHAYCANCFRGMVLQGCFEYHYVPEGVNVFILWGVHRIYAPHRIVSRPIKGQRFLLRTTAKICIDAIARELSLTHVQQSKISWLSLKTAYWGKTAFQKGRKNEARYTYNCADSQQNYFLLKHTFPPGISGHATNQWQYICPYRSLKQQKYQRTHH